jgi:FKBP-type peptidyl-prolyl cis-trans isomerase FkpA
MRNQVIVPLLLLMLVLCVQRNALAQGAVQAVRGAADGLQQPARNGSAPVTAGPVDKQEKVAPGKIDSDASADFTETSSGLKYRILRSSEGKKPVASDSVEVHYKGWLNDGTIFDSSYRRGKTISFPLSGVIKGWTEGMQLVGQGGMIELLIPYRLGYGERGTPNGPIPPRAELHFVVELVSIKE